MAKSKGPKAPNPKDTASAQTSTNIATANANTYGQNGTYTTDDGTRSTTYTYQNVFDPYTGITSQVAVPNTTETLSAPQQAIKNQQNQNELGLGQLAGGQIKSLTDYLGKPFQFDDQKHTQWATDLYNKINAKELSGQQESARARLSNMGLQMGSEAYNNELNRLDASQNRARDQFMLDSYGQDFQTQQALRNQPINEITALMSGSQVSQPTFGHSGAGSIPTTDVAGIINNKYQADMQRYNNFQSNMGGLFSGIGGLFALSDRRAKTDIKKVGKVKGHNVYEYRYKKGGGMQLGVMAQEVEKKMPAAVMTGPDGLKRVNYGLAMGM